MIGRVYNTDYGWMVKENGPFGTYLPLHPDTEESFLSEDIIIEYTKVVFGISDVAKVTKRNYSNNDCEIIGLEGKLQGLRKYLGDLMNIKANPMYKGDLTEEIDRVKGDIRIAEINLDECRLIKNGGKSDRGSI